MRNRLFIQHWETRKIRGCRRESHGFCCLNECPDEALIWEQVDIILDIHAMLHFDKSGMPHTQSDRCTTLDCNKSSEWCYPDEGMSDNIVTIYFPDHFLSPFSALEKSWFV